MQDPRYKHEYLDIGKTLVTITGEDGDESDKHLWVQDRIYLCLI